MKRYPVLVALLGLALTSSLLIRLAVGSQVSHGPVYAVAQVQTGLADHPQDWVGRTVQVRGVAEPCPWWGDTARLWHCADDPLILVPTAADGVAEPLPLIRMMPNGLLTVLRGLPLLHDLVARSWAVPVFTLTHFQLHLHSLPVQACGGRAACFEAVLLSVSK
jgi:hypothetical protein